MHAGPVQGGQSNCQARAYTVWLYGAALVILADKWLYNDPWLAKHVPIVRVNEALWHDPPTLTL